MTVQLDEEDTKMNVVSRMRSLGRALPLESVRTTEVLAELERKLMEENNL